LTVREMIFEYKQSGARSVAKNDKRVRESIRSTGRVAERESGKVQRWMSRNKQAINAVSVATLAAVGGILSAAPSFRAAMSGIRGSFSLLAHTIVSDVLGPTTNFGSIALDLVNRFRDLDESIRRPISAIVLIGGTIVGLLPVIAAFIKSAAAVGGALSGAVAAAKTAAVAIGAITGVAVSTVAAIAALIVAVGALAVAFITDFRGIRTKTLEVIDAVIDLSDVVSGFRRLVGAAGRLLTGDFGGALELARLGLRDLWLAGAQTRQKVLLFIRQMVAGVIERLLAWRNRSVKIAIQIRDAVVQRITDMTTRVLELLTLAREMAAKGRAWVSGLARGVSERAGELADAFRSMASRVARAFKNRFNDLIPSVISIPSVSINIPDILGGGSRTVGGGYLSLPQLDTGGRIASDGLAMLHAGERIMPAAQVRERGPQPTGGDTVTVDTVNIMVSGTGDARTDGRNIAREFERELSDRGAN